jgi:hypothetical protein
VHVLQDYLPRRQKTNIVDVFEKDVLWATSLCQPNNLEKQSGAFAVGDTSF